eukprot:Gb_25247 [translate_table: standard]
MEKLLLWVMITAAFGCCGLLILLLVKVGRGLWWKPLQMKKHFEFQGIRGPPYKFVYGNMFDMLQMKEQAMSRPMELSHDIIPRALPFYDQWTKRYGQTYIHWFGSTVRLNITDPDLIWEVLCNKSGIYKKSTQMKQLNGDGLVSLEGDRWAQHRRIINPAFHIEHLKSMLPLIAASTSNMLDKWAEPTESDAKEIEVCKEFQSLTEHILAHTLFGSSYAEGKHIFDMQAEQALVATEAPRSVYALISRQHIPFLFCTLYLPSRKNRDLRKLEKEIRRSLRQQVESRKQCWRSTNSCGGDLLSVMTACSKEQQGAAVLQKSCMMSIEEIVDECKTFFFAGHDTTLSLLTWTMVLLGMYPTWQERARREVLTVCGQCVPKAENLNHLKLMNMILNESLRLYPPVVALIRQTHQDMQLGTISVPAGTQLLFPILALHQEEALWGKDAKEFNPERFNEGISKAAKHPMAFMPFGLGPRICVGQNFALLQAKVVLAMILQRFSFSLSPAYAHAPIPIVFLQPQFGAQIIINPLCNEY